MPTIISASTIASAQTEWTRAGADTTETAEEPNAFMALVFQQHQRNHQLWREEDKARDPIADDATIAAVKRRIDSLNQQRNDFTEQLDERIASALVAKNINCPADAPWNSETPGSIIDRLSIMALKVFYMREQETRADTTEEHRATCQRKRETLEIQRADLTTALARLLDALFAGQITMKIYRQFKMYNDPSLNPEIYRHQQASQ